MVSVIIPVYNTVKYVERCIKSVTDQTYKELEIIVVDDGSTDGSLDICKRLQVQDKRFFITSQSNAGASMARNKGLDLANGDYIMFVDSDDWIAPNMVEILLKAMKTTDADMVISQVPGDPQLYNSDITISSRQALYHLLSDQAWWSPVGKLFCKKAFKTLRFPKATISEDYRLMSELLLQDMNIRFICSSYYHRTIRTNSLSRSTLCERSFEEIDNVLAVWELVNVCVPVYERFAERNLAETLLKLLLILLTYNNPRKYPEQEKWILSLIRSHYWSMIGNRAILLKQKLLLVGCFSHLTSKLTVAFTSHFTSITATRISNRLL